MKKINDTFFHKNNIIIFVILTIFISNQVYAVGKITGMFTLVNSKPVIESINVYQSKEDKDIISFNINVSDLNGYEDIDSVKVVLLNLTNDIEPKFELGYLNATFLSGFNMYAIYTTEYDLSENNTLEINNNQKYRIKVQVKDEFGAMSTSSKDFTLVNMTNSDIKETNLITGFVVAYEDNVKPLFLNFLKNFYYKLKSVIS